MHVFYLGNRVVVDRSVPGRGCPQVVKMGYKHNIKAPDDLMLLKAHDKYELKLLKGPYKERERMLRRDLDNCGPR